MFSIVITEKSGAQRQLEFDASELTIGRLEGNDLVLPRSNVSKRHARLVLKDDRYVVVDLGSTNGTYVNGRRISAPMVVRKGDKVYIGDFIVGLVRSVEEHKQMRSAIGAAGNIRASSKRPHRATSLGVSPDASAPDASAPPAAPLPSAAAAAAGTVPDEIDFDDAEELDTVMGEPIQMSPVSRPPPPPKISAPPPPPPPPVERLPSDPNTTQPVAPPAMSRAQSAPTPEPKAAPKQAKPEAKSQAKPEAKSQAKPEAKSQAKPEAKSQAEPDSRPPPAKSATSSAPAVTGRQSRPSFPPRLEDPESAQTSAAVLAPSVRLQGALNTLMEQLATKMDVEGHTEGAFPSEHEATLDALIDDLAKEGVVGPDLDRRFLRESAICEAVGLGPLDRLLSNHAVREVVIDGPARILANLGGELSPVSMFFSSGDAMITVARRLLARAGQTLDRNAPVQAGVLPDGTQIELLLPPLSVNGPLITIRCPAKTSSSADGLVTEGAMSPDMLDTLRVAMRRRDNILVVGAPGAGVSLMLGVLAGMAQEHERIVTLEETPNMAIAHPQVLPLSRAGSELSISELLALATRLRYDRLVVDDLRPGDALGMLLTASTGRGVLMGMKAASPRAALQQLELFSQREMAGARVSLSVLLSQAIKVIVHVDADVDGSRRLRQITEVLADGDGVKLRTLFKFDGRFKATEHAAAFRDQ